MYYGVEVGIESSLPQRRPPQVVGLPVLDSRLFAGPTPPFAELAQGRAGPDLSEPLQLLLKPVQKPKLFQRVQIPVLQLPLNGLDALESQLGFEM